LITREQRSKGTKGQKNTRKGQKALLDVVTRVREGNTHAKTMEQGCEVGGEKQPPRGLPNPKQHFVLLGLRVIGRNDVGGSIGDGNFLGDALRTPCNEGF
jgi:hypothetical protein